MPVFAITKADGNTVRIEAASFHEDGPALYLYFSDGRFAATFDRFRSCILEPESEPLKFRASLRRPAFVR